jgi:multiple sugar transport system permease protein
MEADMEFTKWFNKLNVQRILIYSFIIVLFLIVTFPMYIILIDSTRLMEDIQLSGPSFVPDQYFPWNLYVLFAYVGVGWPLLNSIFVSVSSTILTAYFSTLTAFGLEFYNLKWKKPLYVIIILFIMIPTQLSIIGLYQLCLTFKMTNSFLPLILPSIANCFGVFFIKQYMSAAVPHDIIEAARIDGANELSIFNKIVYPMVTPAIAAVSLLSFIKYWNQFIEPRVLIYDQSMYTFPIVMSFLTGQSAYISMGIIITIIPVLIFFMKVSKSLVGSIASGALKG